MKKDTKIFIAILVVIIIVAGGVLAYKIFSGEEQQPIIEEPKTEEVAKPVEKQVEIFKGTDRPIAVMIDNHKDAWPQAGLNKTYMVYEIIVEGGETRLMALFKGADVDKIGPIRSSRHYFLDYALENDAIYVHYGWSPQAKRDITKLGVDNIHGITESTSDFKRVKDKRSPHNVVTNTDSILKIAKEKKYKTTSDQKSVLNYVTDEVDLSANETEENIAKTAEVVTIPHSYLQTVKYKYDSDTKRYTRYARNKLQKDWDSEKPITTKNIIIEFVNNSSLSDGSSKGRQTISNIGTFDGYYITNGKAIKIKCTKSARDKQTVYKDLNGEEIKVNDGNTWVNICPKDAKVKLEAASEKSKQ